MINCFGLYFHLIKRHQPCRLLTEQHLTLPSCLSNRVLSRNLDRLSNLSFSLAFPTSQDMYVPDSVHKICHHKPSQPFQYLNIVFAFHAVPLILQISASLAMPQIHHHENQLLDSSGFNLCKRNHNLGSWVSSG